MRPSLIVAALVNATDASALVAAFLEEDNDQTPRGFKLCVPAQICVKKKCAMVMRCHKPLTLPGPYGF